MNEHSPSDVSNIPAWLQLFLASVTGAVVGIATLIRWGFSINTRLQRIENQDLEGIIDGRIAKDRHDHLYPMMQTRVFSDLEKMEVSYYKLSQDVAVLLERDRLNQRLEQVISALNAQALKPPQT